MCFDNDACDEQSQTKKMLLKAYNIYILQVCGNDKGHRLIDIIEYSHTKQLDKLTCSI